MGRPKKETKKTNISLTINEKLNSELDKFLDEKKLSKSEYIEYLIKKDQQKTQNNLRPLWGKDNCSRRLN